MKNIFREIVSLFHAEYLNLTNKNISISYHQNWSGILIRVHNAGKLSIGNYLKCRPHCSICVEGGKMNIGNDCFFNSNVSVTCLNRISIGNNVQIGNNTVIVDHNHDYQKGHGYICKDIEICDNVWIGANCVILPGVKIRGGQSLLQAV